MMGNQKSFFPVSCILVQRQTIRLELGDRETVLSPLHSHEVATWDRMLFRGEHADIQPSPFKFLCASAVYGFFSRAKARRTGFPSSTHCCLTVSTRKPDVRAITRISPGV